MKNVFNSIDACLAVGFKVEFSQNGNNCILRVIDKDRILPKHKQHYRTRESWIPLKHFSDQRAAAELDALYLQLIKSDKWDLQQPTQ